MPLRVIPLLVFAAAVAMAASAQGQDASPAKTNNAEKAVVDSVKRVANLVVAPVAGRPAEVLFHQFEH